MLQRLRLLLQVWLLQQGEPLPLTVLLLQGEPVLQGRLRRQYVLLQCEPALQTLLVQRQVYLLRLVQRQVYRLLLVRRLALLPLPALVLQQSYLPRLVVARNSRQLQLYTYLCLRKVCCLRLCLCTLKYL